MTTIAKPRLFGQGQILKSTADDEQRIVYMWANVSEAANGTGWDVLVDLEGQFIVETDMEKMAHAFQKDYRVADQRHDFKKIGIVLHSIPLTKALQKELGIPPGHVHVGWLVGVYVEDDAVWQKVKSGEYAMASIGGDHGGLEEVAA